MRAAHSENASRAKRVTLHETFDNSTQRKGTTVRSPSDRDISTLARLNPGAVTAGRPIPSGRFGIVRFKKRRGVPMFSRSALISVTVAVLGVLAGAAAAAERDPNLEIIIQVRDGAVGLPSPHAAVAPQLASLRSDLRDVLAHPNVLQIERVSPDAKRSESYHVTRDGRAVRTIDMSNVYRIRVATSAMRERLIEQLRVTEDVVFADPNQSIELRSLPNDPDLKLQWAVKNTGQASGRPGADIGVEQAWAYSTGSPLVRIGVVDLGVDPLHPEFGGRVTGTTGSDIHATGVASIAAAAG